MLGTVVRVVLAAALAVAALALVAYGAILISAAITGSSDTAPEVLVGFGVAFVPGAIVAGCTRSVTAPTTEANFPFSVTGGVAQPRKFTSGQPWLTLNFPPWLPRGGTSAAHTAPWPARLNPLGARTARLAGSPFR
jgi:hypothetical protein